MTLRIPQRGNKPSRLAVIAVKYASGFIPIKSSSLLCGSKSSCSAADKVRVCAIRAEEIDPPPNIESIDWTLLTNVPVNNMDDALEKIKWYRLRWKVEEYFRVLKSGCKIEASRLSTTARLQRLIAIKSIIAFKILYLSKVALANPTEICTTILSHDEWSALYMQEHQTNKLPDKLPNIKEAIIWLGKLGGFMNRKSDGLPGSMTLWRGYENLKQSLITLSILDYTTCG